MCFFILPVLLLINLWLFFFETNTDSATTQNLDKNTQLNSLKLTPKISYANYYVYLGALCYNSIFIFKGTTTTIWYNHICILNFSLWWVLAFYLLSLLFFIIINVVSKYTDLTQNTDYMFSLINLLVILPYLFFTNTVFSFLFFLEIISAILLYKLVSSKIWFNNEADLVTKSTTTEHTPINYITMIFFQYWVTFFSTIYIVFFYINIYVNYGSSEWLLIQYVNFYDANKNLLVNEFFKKFSFSVFLFSILFKLGITPFHLFKVEVYKGLPILSLFFYTTYYFVIFFVYFLYILYDLLNVFIDYNYINFIVLLIIGSVYTIILLFDVVFLKIFFTYSTVINTIAFLMVFVSIIGLV